MRLTIHRGSHEIGGSCIEVEQCDTRIVLDAGLPLVNANREPFDQRSVRGKTVEQLQQEGTVPKVPGLFTTGPPPNAILLSHSHLDHSGLLHLSRAEIPIYASKGTSKMMLATGVFSGQKELDRARHRQITPGQPLQIGPFRITPYAVDHSAFGSMALLIEAGGTRLLYSGDLRMHGRKPGMIKTLIGEVAPRQVDVLLMEGTHIGSDRQQGITEYELEEQIIQQVRSARGLVFAAFSPIDVDRLVTFYRAAQRSGRTFVVDAYGAFIMHMVASEAKIPRPTREAGIRVYFNAAFEVRKLENIQQRFASERIRLQEILGEPTKHMMMFRPSMVTLDFMGKLPKSSRCLYSYWQGYLKNPDWTQLRKDLDAVEGDFIPVHASGHIYVEDIVRFVNQIGPKTVIPIHTFEPQLFNDHFSNVRLLQDGEQFTISGED